MAFELVQIQQQPNFKGMDLDTFLSYMKENGQANDIFNQPNETRLDDSIIKRKISNGLNMGNKTISDYINANNIRTPQTEEEIYDAGLGLFNQPEPLKTSVQTSPSLLDRFTAGYRDNYDNSFKPKNLEKDASKNWSYRLGEGLGTVGRFIDSPLGRGLIAGGLNKALGYDDSFLEGLQAFAGRQNAVTADKLYRKQLKDYGYTDEDLGQIRGNITSDMYKNLTTNLYRNKKLTQDQAIKQMNWVRQAQLARQLDDDTASAMMSKIMANTDFNDMGTINFQDSNQTRNTNSQIAYRDKRLDQYDQQLSLLDKKISLTAANSAERNNLMRERNKILKDKQDYEQNNPTTKNKILSNQQVRDNLIEYKNEKNSKNKQIQRDWFIKNTGYTPEALLGEW